MSSTRVFDKDAEFWTNYLSGRPKPPEAFYEQIFTYHASRGGKFGTVHDAGAGAGVHTAQLAKQFDELLVSDIEEQNVTIAKERLAHIPNKTTFHTAKLEDATWIAPESVDLMFAASCINWCDLPAAIAAVDHQLKPGGTFAVAGMGFAALEEPRVQEVWYQLFQRAVDRNFIQREHRDSQVLSALACDASAYDAVPLPEDVFERGALRCRVNFPPGWSWYHALVPAEREDKVPRWSQVGPCDRLVEEQQEGWSFMADLAALKEMATSFPIWGETVDSEDQWRRLEEMVGTDKVKGVWPMVLILATKKG